MRILEKHFYQYFNLFGFLIFVLCYIYVASQTLTFVLDIILHTILNILRTHKKSLGINRF